MMKKLLPFLIVFGIVFSIGCIGDNTSSQQVTQYVCSDGTIVSNSSQCPVTHQSYCGNDICDSGETCSSCSGDCGSCPASYCGDGSCNGAETCSSCSTDCGQCKNDLGYACSYNSDCKSNYCIHGVCRSSSTYCGDWYCDTGETYSTCSSDCATFTVGSVYFSGDKITKTGENSFQVIGQTQIGQSSPVVIIPIEFKTPAKDVTYNIYCYSSEPLISYGYSSLDENYPAQDYLRISSNNFSMFSYFGYGGAIPYILSTGKDFGTHINDVGIGGIRIISVLGPFPDKDLTIKCTFNIISNDPPFNSKSEINISHIR